MPRYIADLPDLGSDLDDIDRRLTLLEQSSGAIADPATSVTGTVGGTTSAATGTPSSAFGSGGSASGGASSGTGSGGGTATVGDGSITYIKLASDVPTTLDTRFVNVTGDTMTGALTVGATLTANALTTSGTLNASGAATLGSLTVSTGSTLSGGLTVTNGTISNSTVNAGMELGAVGQSNSPYIDFHSSISSTDYDGRIIASGGTSSAGAGTLDYYAATHAFHGNLSVTGTFTGASIVTSVGAGNQISITGTSSAPVVNVVTSPTFSGNVSVGGTLAVTGVPTFTGAAVFSSGITTKDFITGGAGAGLGNIAASTVQGYNVLDGSIPFAKLTPGAQATIAANNPDTPFGFLRSATSATADANGNAVGNLLTSAARVTDALAYDGQALKATAGTTADGTFVCYGPYYGQINNTGIADNLYPNQGYGLKPGDYRAQVFMRVASAASTSAVAIVDVNDGAGTVTGMTALTVTPAMLGSTNYVAVSVPFTITASTRNTISKGLEVRTRYQAAAGTDLYVSHVIVTPSPLGAGEITTTYFRDAAITSAKISDLSAAKITAGTMTADITQSGILRTGPDTGARLVLDSGGLRAYSSASTNTVNIASNGTASFTGTVTASAGLIGGWHLASGKVFSGASPDSPGTVTLDQSGYIAANATPAGSYVVMTGRSDLPGLLYAYNSGGTNTFKIDQAGNLTVSGAINATSGAFSGSITSTATITGGTIAGANINSTNLISGAAITAGTITTNALSISNGFSDNLILNGSFDYETSPGSGVAANWTLNYETTGTSPVNFRDGGTYRSGQSGMTVGGNTNASGAAVASSSIPVAAGDVLSVRGYVMNYPLTATPGTTVVVRMFWGTSKDFVRGGATVAGTNPTITVPLGSNAGGSGTGYTDIVGGALCPTTGTYYPVEATVTVPTGCTWARLGLYGWTSSGADANAVPTHLVMFDDWSVRRQLTSTSISDGAIVARKLSVTVGGDNLVPNSSYESNVANPFSIMSGVVTWAYVTSGVLRGTRYVGLRRTASGDPYTFHDLTGSNFPTQVAGKRIFLSWDWYGTSTKAPVDLPALQGSGGGNNYYITPTITVGPSASPGTSWGRAGGYIDMPPVMDDNWHIVMRPVGDSTDTTNWIYYDGWMISVGDVYVGYQAKTDEILPGTIVSNMISTSGITADNIATGQLKASSVIYAGGTTGTRVEIDGRTGTRGIRLYDGSNINTVNLDATTGNGTFTGTVNATAGTFSGNVNVTGTLTGGTIDGATITGGTITGGRFYNVAILGNSAKLGLFSARTRHLGNTPGFR